MTTYDEQRAAMAELIERSSFGTPEAVALRALTPAWVREMILMAPYDPPRDQSDTSEVT